MQAKDDVTCAASARHTCCQWGSNWQSMGKVSQRGAKACLLPPEVWLAQSTFFKKLLIYLILAAESFLLRGLSPVAASEGYSPGAVRGLLLEVASFAKQGLQGAQASVVMA